MLMHGSFDFWADRYLSCWGRILIIDLYVHLVNALIRRIMYTNLQQLCNFQRSIVSFSFNYEWKLNFLQFHFSVSSLCHTLSFWLCFVWFSFSRYSSCHIRHYSSIKYYVCWLPVQLYNYFMPFTHNAFQHTKIYFLFIVKWKESNLLEISPMFYHSAHFSDNTPSTLKAAKRHI